MSENTASTTTKDPSLTEYIPHGEQEKIKISMGIVKKLLCKPTRSGAICPDRDAMMFIAKCRAQKLNPFLGDCYIVGYDGKFGPEFSIITGVNVFYKRAEADPNFDGMESGVIVSKDEQIQDMPGDFVPDGFDLVGGWAIVQKKNRKIPTVSKVALKTFRKQTKFWEDNPAGMIVKCAEVDALRRAFPFVLGDMRASIEGAHMPDFDAVPIQSESQAQKQIQDMPERLDPLNDDSNPDLVPERKVEQVREVNEKRASGPKESLQQFLDSNRIPFTSFQKWLIDHPNIYPQADSLGSIMELPAAEADRILRLAKKALVEIAQYCKEGNLL